MSKPDAKKAALRRRKQQEKEQRKRRMQSVRQRTINSPFVAPSFPMGGRIGARLSFYKFWGEKVVSVFRLHSGLKSSEKD